MYYSYMRFCSGDGNSAGLRELSLYPQSLLAKLTVDKVLKSLLQIVFNTSKGQGGLHKAQQQRPKVFLLTQIYRLMSV